MKKFGLFFFSTFGVAACLAIVVGLNIIASFAKHRFDLTAEKLFTLSDGTRQILRELDTSVKIRFYATRDDKVMPPQFKTHIRLVEDLLDEFRRSSGGKIQVEKFDPQPDSDAEDSARLDGVESQALSLTERIYLGLAVSMLDETVPIPFLDPSREEHLEYEIIRAVSQVMTVEETVIGVMSSLPVFGANPMMARMGQAQRQSPWVVIEQLQQLFEVREIEMTAESVDEEVTVLIVIHPKAISETTEYALDQFLLKGGNLLVFLDPLALTDPQPSSNNMMGPPPSTSNLPNLLKAWGLEFDSGKVLADMSFAKEISFGQGPAQIQPAVLFVNDNGINRSNVVTAQIDQLLMPFAGAFSGEPLEELEQTVLIHSTEQSQLVDGFMARLAGQQIARDFAAEDKKRHIALRLDGKFKTAFSEGKPKTEEDSNEEEDIDKEDEEEETEEESLKESKEDGAVVLFGDADFLADPFSVRVENFFGARLISTINGNLALAQNLVEQLAGDNRLIHVRSRASMNRPFTRIQRKQREAEEKYRSEIRALEEKRQQTQTKLNELQRNRTDVSQGQRFVLSKEQQAELEKLRKQEVETNRQLKTMRRDLRKEVDALETFWKWLNIAFMPVVVAFIGIFTALIKRIQTAAR